MKRFKNYLYILKMTIKGIPIWSIYTIANNIFGVLCSILGSVIMVNVVLTGISLNKSLIEILIPVLIIQLIIITGGICTSIYYGKIDPISRQKLQEKITSRLINNIMTTQMKNLDNPKYLGDFTFSINQIEARTTGSIFLISNFISNVVGIFLSLTIIGYINWELVVLVILVVFVSLILNNALTKIQFRYDNEIVLPGRKKSYVERTYHMKKFALEIRLYPISELLTKIYDNAVKDIVAVIKKHGFIMGVLAFIKAYNQEIILYWGSMVVIIFKLFGGHMTIEPVSVIPVTIAVYGLSNYILALTGIYNTLKEHELYSEKLLHFLNIDDDSIEKKRVNSDRIHEIAFKNVTFKYSSEDKFSLRNVSMQIKAGEKVALVGVNGSGKSTIIKLLLGLYDDYSGEITINEESITKFDMQNYREQFSVVQQDFQHYSCTLAENVLMDSAEKTDVSKIKCALESVGFELNLISDADLLSKPITSEFCPDGLSLSKGQYQKLALARVFLSNKNYIVLDEPTSALDPVSEYKVFNHLLEHFKEKTIIIISHRLTATKNADKIYLIDNGEIVEYGSHKQLMELGGRYSEMYLLQSQKYL